MLTKEDYMKLPKERLAELLVEKDNPFPQPTIYIPFNKTIPCYDPDGICTNPQRDCINCPRCGTNIDVITTTDTTGSAINAKRGNPLDYIEQLNKD